MLRCLPALLLVAAALLLVPGEAGARGCPGAHARPTPHNAKKVRAALQCLHNRARAARGLRRLRRNARLTRAATGHSRRMVRAHFFSHVTPSGARVSQRTRRAGYARRRSFVVGENLGWGTGARATPRRIFRAWMGSPAHRMHILDGSYRSIGIGVVRGAPQPGWKRAGTYTVVYGTR
jgi:uncharacterized protein YkwD